LPIYHYSIFLEPIIPSFHYSNIPIAERSGAKFVYLMFRSLTIKNLAEKQIRIIRQPTNTMPIIRLVEDNGIQGVVKDFSVNGFIYRNIIGRFLLWREGRVYRRLRGIKGIPVFYRKIDGLALVISKVPGRDLAHLS